MQHEIDFKNIWQQQKISPPDIQGLFAKLKQFRKQNVLKLIFLNIALTGTCGFIIYIWLHYQPQFISTKIGIVLVILAMVIYLIAYNKQLLLLKALNGNQSNTDYLQNLIALKRNQKHLQTTMLNLYFLLLSSGICLYMYEFALQMVKLWSIVAYAATLSWIAFHWFFTRPKTIKKQQQKIDELINRFEAVNKYLKDE